MSKRLFIVILAAVLAGCRITAIVEGEGRITSTSGNFDCDSTGGPDCAEEYQAAGQEMFEALPAPGFHLARWTGCSDAVLLDCLANVSTQAVERSLQWTITAEFEPNLPPVEPAAYTYNAFGQRITKTVADHTTIYQYDLSGNLIAEINGQGEVLRQTVYLGTLPVAQLRSSEGGEMEPFYLHPDHLGTPVLVTDGDGNVVADVERTPFGEPYAAHGAGDLPMVFPGQDLDAETGLAYNYFRHYDASTGRYLQPDPIGLAGGLNTYAYALQNPIRNSDPTGQAVPFVTACAASPVCVAAVTTAARTIAGAAIGGLSALNEVLGDPCYKGNLSNPVIVGTLFGGLTGALPGSGSLSVASARGATAGALGNASGQISRNDGLRAFDPYSNLAAAGTGAIASGVGNIAGLAGALAATRAGATSRQALAVGASEGSALSTLVQFVAGTASSHLAPSDSCRCED